MKVLCLLTLAALLLLPRPARADDGDRGFFLGVDVSELLAQENSGVKYYDRAGNEGDALAILAGYGVEHIRLRVWNDPYDENGNGYGGGNADADTAARLSARAAAFGMETLVDFHYSDFWADPSRQLAPKAWRGMTPDEKASALYDFTRDTLTHILDAGGLVDMVQVGNEITTGLAGETDPGTVARLIGAGWRAVRDTAASRGLRIRVSVHLTDIQDMDMIEGILSRLDEAGADYDAVGVSYYPYWHGSLDTLKYAIDRIRTVWGRDVFVAETAWPFTLKDGDHSGNVISADPGIYPVSAPGQARAVREVCRAAREAGAFGAYYWGGIWTGAGDDEAANRVLWEKYGCGWATRFASGYDPEHVGDAYGGCAWENQALFDFSGRPLEALEAVRQVADERTADDQTAPERPNYVRNPGFEDGDRSMWQTVTMTDDMPFDYQDYAADAHTGTVAFHYWSTKDMRFAVQQTVDGLPQGLYEAAVWSQGGDMTDASLVLYVWADGICYEAPFMNTSWADWQHPVISGIPVSGGSVTLGVRVKCGALSWGTLDDFSLTRTD